jgi:hypothetical protein
VCSIDLHMLHLRGARCGRSAAASAAAAAAPSRAACAREAPSAPDRTPPLAIYVRFFALFLFLALVFIHSFFIYISIILYYV